MEGWILFWTLISLLGVIAYVITFVYITPMGLRDIFGMFQQLDDSLDLGETESGKDQVL